LLLFGDENQATYIGVRGAPTWGLLHTLDTLPYPNGQHKLRLRIVRDDKNYQEYFTDITIANSAAEQQAYAARVAESRSNGFRAPAEGENVYGTVTINAVAQLPDGQFEKWQLDLLLYNDENQATNLTVNNRPANGTLMRLDTRAYPNGEHTLRLRVVRQDFNYDEYFVKVVFNN
ncbi:MAG: hypothetical protein KDE46_31195, partial [Caldilineaceae bacterium]|nr:hypothetical protein [Caldilineaceae bacterium]